MPLQKQKKPSNKASEEPRRSKPKSANQNAKHSRPKVDHKGQGRRVAERGPKD